MYTPVTQCRICKQEELYPFLMLGDIPLPNGFVAKKDIRKKEPVYPLNVAQCTTCGLAQLTELVDPKEMFDNYVYIPSMSQTRMANFAQIVEQAQELVPFNEKTLAIDIGSNDGSLLSYFKNKGVRTLGVDPAKNLAKIAELKGIETINDYVSPKVARKIVKKYGHANVITATNVVAHIGNLHELMQTIEILLAPNGVFICEFPYLVDLIEKNQFDTIYHEHLSYFSVKPLVKLLDQSKLYIEKIVRTPIDGGSLRTFIKKRGAKNKHQHTDSVAQLLQLEDESGLYNKKVLKEFNKRVKAMKKDLNELLRKLKKQKKTIAGYGAAAKGNILLNYCNINNTLIDFIVDSTPYKQGLFTPGSKIPILPESALREHKPDFTLILAWNFADEIMRKERAYTAAGGKFIVPVPKVSLFP